MSSPTEIAEDTKPDMTPMIDVVFLMIVFFVCIDLKVLEAKLPAFLPRDRGVAVDTAEPQECLTIRVHVEAAGTPVLPRGATSGAIDPNTGRPYRHRLDGHRIRWEVGPIAVHTLDQLQAELRRIAADPGSEVVDPHTGGRKLMACRIEPLQGCRYEDVARTTDAAHTAGFPEITFAGGAGPR